MTIALPVGHNLAATAAAAAAAAPLCRTAPLHAMLTGCLLLESYSISAYNKVKSSQATFLLVRVVESHVSCSAARLRPPSARPPHSAGSTAGRDAALEVSESWDPRPLARSCARRPRLGEGGASALAASAMGASMSRICCNQLGGTGVGGNRCVWGTVV